MSNDQEIRNAYERGHRDGERAARAWCAAWLRETADEPATCHTNGCDALRDAADALEQKE